MAEPQTNYRWVIVVVATLALVISNGLTIGGLPPFYKPMCEEFVLLGAVDASRAETFIYTYEHETRIQSCSYLLRVRSCQISDQFT